MTTTSKRKKRKYNLHYKLRKKGYQLKSRSRTIFCPSGQLENIPDQAHKLVDEYNYVIQIILE